MNQSKKQILFHIPAPPIPADTGSKRRVLGILNYFKERSEFFSIDVVSINPFGQELWNLEERQAIQNLVNNFFIYDGSRNLLDFFYARSQSFYYQSILKQQIPIDADYDTPPCVVSFFNKIVHANNYDFVWINYINYFHLAGCLKDIQTKTVLDMHDLSCQGRLVKQKTFPFFKNLKFDYESCFLKEVEILNKFDIVIANSEQEISILSPHISTNRIHLVPHSVGNPSKVTCRSLPYPDRNFKYDLLFVGSAYGPNIEGINFFLNSIFTKIIAQVSNVRLAIAGTVTQSIHLEKSLEANTICLGFVPNLSELYLTSKIFICPLLDGAGTKVKLLEAMSHSLPIVATTAGASGLKLRNGVNAFVVDEPHLYADCILRLLQNPKLAQEFSEAIASTFTAKYSNSAIYTILDRILNVSE